LVKGCFRISGEFVGPPADEIIWTDEQSATRPEFGDRRPLVTVDAMRRE
jgi:hypothetical protein